MSFDRYLGYHFTQTSVYVCEAFLNRENQLEWEVIEQANYELPAEWLALYKEAIPNLYDTEKQVFGFQALPAIWRSFSPQRFHRYDASFFSQMVKGNLGAAGFHELQSFLRYTLVYHVKPQPDEPLHISMVLEDVPNKDGQYEAILAALQQHLIMPNIHFKAIISPQEAVLRSLWYESMADSDQINSKVLLVINIGYVYTEFTMWRLGTPERPARAQGARQIDLGVASHVGRNNPTDRTIGAEELAIHAQRARADYKTGQEPVVIFQQDDTLMEIAESDYLDLVASGVDDIVSRLERLLRSQGDEIDEVILTGEGVAFEPIRHDVAQALGDLPTRIVDQPALICARGAAGLSYDLHDEKV
ncbi:MAG: hypothetical protein GYB68_05400 [Chloroflexi bacterium]|nr:hypothetical protein [Chloroflexota bacterium]